MLALNTDKVNASLEKHFMMKNEYLSSISHERLLFSSEVQHKNFREGNKLRNMPFYIVQLL